MGINMLFNIYIKNGASKAAQQVKVQAWQSELVHGMHMVDGGTLSCTPSSSFQHVYCAVLPTSHPTPHYHEHTTNKEDKLFKNNSSLG